MQFLVASKSPFINAEHRKIVPENLDSTCNSVVSKVARHIVY